MNFQTPSRNVAAGFCGTLEGDRMPDGLEVTKAAIDDFAKVQRRMLLARKENALETYADLKKKYLSLKAILNVEGVNLTDIDEIKE